MASRWGRRRWPGTRGWTSARPRSATSWPRLEEVGLLAAPHSSAGRIPTAQGYRLFVDRLLQVKPLGDVELQRLRSELPAGAGTQALLGSTSELLSAMTHFVGMVSVPRRESFAFRQIDFVALDRQRVLAILVFADDEVQNRVIAGRAAPSIPSELEQTAQLSSTPISPGSRWRRSAPPCCATCATRAARWSACWPAPSTWPSRPSRPAARAPRRMLLAGQTRLMGVQDLSDLDRLRALFEAFAGKRELLQLLERTAKAPGVRVFIGEETGMAPLDGMSLVTAPYGADGRVLGVLGVIGPSRMAYERVIPVVQATAAMLGAALDAPP